MKNCPIKMWAKFNYQDESDRGIGCDGPECAWYIWDKDKGDCAVAFLSMKLANIEVILGHKTRR